MALKVVLGLSDGVDSAVAAHILLEKGFDVLGVYLDIGGEEERTAALESAKRLGIPCRVENVRERLEKYVCEPFRREYLRGRTPSPCVACNPDMKFAVLTDVMNETGADRIATGHYVRCENGHLYTGQSENDQSYMLARLRREQIDHLLLPLGAMHKADTRALALASGLKAADRPDSRENCFIRNMTYAEWIESRGEIPPRGNALFRGKVIGTHEGIHRYTVGQRWPEMIGERRVYVSRIDAETDTLTLVLWEELFRTEFSLSGVHMLEDLPETFRGSVRVRHTRWEQPECTVTLRGDTAHVITDTPVRAPAPGQAAALYVGDMLVGGGWIEQPASGTGSDG